MADGAKASPATSTDSAIRSLVSTLDSLENAFAPTGISSVPGSQDVLHYGFGLLMEVTTTVTALDGASGPVTRGERERVAELAARWRTLRAAAARAMPTGVDAVNARLTQDGLPPLKARTLKP
jgi:hypothetical protein